MSSLKKEPDLPYGPDWGASVRVTGGATGIVGSLVCTVRESQLELLLIEGRGGDDERVLALINADSIETYEVLKAPPALVPAGPKSIAELIALFAREEVTFTFVSGTVAYDVPYEFVVDDIDPRRHSYILLTSGKQPPRRLRWCQLFSQSIKLSKAALLATGKGVTYEWRPGDDGEGTAGVTALIRPAPGSGSASAEADAAKTGVPRRS